jgi:P27 family predicted phage terminase small subunit
MRGRRPTPDAKKELAGVKPSRRNKREPRPKAGVPGMPSWLSAEAKAEWRRVVPELHRIGVLVVLDRAALAAYCQAFAEFVEATRRLEKEGHIIDSPITSRKRVTVDGKAEWETVVIGYRKVPHPAVRLQRSAMTICRQYLAEFGLSPLSRPRIQATPPPKPENPKSRFFRHRDGSVPGATVPFPGPAS